MATDTPTPLTAQHRAAFKRYAQKWQRILSLQDWRVVLGSKKSKEMADVTCHLKDRLAVLAIGSDFGSIEVDSTSLEEIALHEMLHVFLHEYGAFVAAATSEEDIASAEHRVINTLTKLLMSKDNA